MKGKGKRIKITLSVPRPRRAIRRRPSTQKGRGRLSASQKDLVTALRNASNATRSAILTNADKKVVETLVDCVRLLINDKNALSDSQYRALRRRSEDIRRIISPSSTLAEKKTLFQRGGLLPLLLATPTISRIIDSRSRQRGGSSARRNYV